MIAWRQRDVTVSRHSRIWNKRLNSSVRKSRHSPPSYHSLRLWPLLHESLCYPYTPLHQHIICSATAIAALPATVDALGARRAMITCGPTILRACDVVPRVQEALGFRYVDQRAHMNEYAVHDISVHCTKSLRDSFGLT